MQGSLPTGSLPTALIQRAASEPLRVNGATLRADIANLTPTHGDQCANTAITGPGGRKVIYEGAPISKWKPLSGVVLEGTVTLVAGTATLSNTSVTATTKVLFGVYTPGGTQGFLSYVRNTGTSIVFNSTSAAETSVLWYKVLEWA